MLEKAEITGCTPDYTSLTGVAVATDSQIKILVKFEIIGVLLTISHRLIYLKIQSVIFGHALRWMCFKGRVNRNGGTRLQEAKNSASYEDAVRRQWGH